MRMTDAEFGRAHDKWLNSNNPADAPRDEEYVEELKRDLENDLERLYDEYEFEGLEEDEIIDVIGNFV